MAHVHGEKAATQMKSVVNAGAAKMMDSSMGKMGMGPMMGLINQKNHLSCDHS